MSLTQAILDEMSQRGVTARVDGATLRLKPREALDDDLLARIKEHKPEIIRALAAIPPMPEGVRLVNWEPKPAPGSDRCLLRGGGRAEIRTRRTARLGLAAKQPMDDPRRIHCSADTRPAASSGCGSGARNRRIAGVCAAGDTEKQMAIAAKLALQQLADQPMRNRTTL